MVQRPDQRQHRACGLGQVDPGVGALVAGKVGPLGQILFARRRVIHQRLDDTGKCVHCCGIAFGIQRQGGFARGDVEQRLFDNVAFVNAALNHMPCDPVARFAVEQRPDRGIQPGIAWQGAVVEIDRALCGAGQQSLRNNLQIGDAEQPVKRGADLIHRLHRQPISGGPIGHIGVAGDDGADAVPGIQQHLPTVQGQGFIADQQGGKAGHDETFVSWAGRLARFGPRSCHSIVRRKCGAPADVLPVSRQRIKCSAPPVRCASVAQIA